MERLIAFLRGINISGKNKIPMEQLKRGFEEAGFTEVATYLNSGNVIFRGNSEEISAITERIEKMIRRRFSLDIPVFVLPAETLERVINHAPDWWGNESEDIYDNLIFILPPETAETVQQALGEPKKEYERAEAYQNTIFWSFDRAQYAKTNWWARTASSEVGRYITIRTAGTVRRLVRLCAREKL